MNKKGFTLIELLAIIVILAIIALIGTPIVTRIINTSRINSAEQTCNGVISAAKNLYSVAILRDPSFDGVTLQFSNDATNNPKITWANTSFAGSGITFDMDNTKPTNGLINITRDGNLKGEMKTDESGNVTYEPSVLTVNGYTCTAVMANDSISSYTCK